MLLRSLCVVVLFYLPALAESQVFQRGDFAIGPMYQVHMLGKTRSFEAVYGIQASFFIRDHISLDYSLGYTTVPLAPNYYKVYGGGVLGGYGIIMAANSYNISTEAWWALTVLSLAIPEGVSYHIPVNNQLVISPYLNLLTVDIGEDYWRMSNTLGVRFNMVLGKKLNLAPYGFIMTQYRGSSAGGSVGGYGAGVLGRWVF